MKRTLTALCALVLFAAGVAPALAAETPLPSCYYPISVEEYTYGPFDELRVNKTYQLSLSDDPRLIPTDDFERNGRRYYLLDIVKENTTGVDTREYTESITMDSDTGDMSAVLKDLNAQMEVTTEDGYTGTLILDHTSVTVEVKGYQTSTKNLSATRTYPSLSDPDVSLIPKTVTDNGNTLTLADVQWSSSESLDGEGGIVTRYTATAKYTGTVTSRYATGYTVTADYTGQVAKTNCEVVIYTAIFGSVELPKQSAAPDVTAAPTESTAPDSTTDDAPISSVDWAGLKTPLMIGGVIFIAAAGGFFIFRKLRR